MLVINKQMCAVFVVCALHFLTSPYLNGCWSHTIMPVPHNTLFMHNHYLHVWCKLQKLLCNQCCSTSISWQHLVAYVFILNSHCVLVALDLVPQVAHNTMASLEASCPTHPSMIKTTKMRTVLLMRFVAYCLIILPSIAPFRLRCQCMSPWVTVSCM